MRQGFTLLELIFGLFVFQVGLLAVAGMVFLAQQNLLRSQLTLRGLLEAERVVDSLQRGGADGEGQRSFEWGQVIWAPASDEVGGVEVKVFAPAVVDTVVELRALPRAENTWSPVHQP